MNKDYFNDRSDRLRKEQEVKPFSVKEWCKPNPNPGAYEKARDSWKQQIPDKKE